MMIDQVLRRNRLFGCHSQKLRKEREEKKKKRERNIAEEMLKKEEKEKEQCMVMHEHVTCKPKMHHGKKPNPNYSTHID